MLLTEIGAAEFQFLNSDANLMRAATHHLRFKATGLLVLGSIAAASSRQLD